MMANTYLSITFYVLELSRGLPVYKYQMKENIYKKWFLFYFEG